MRATAEASYNRLLAHVREAELLRAAVRLLDWDQRVTMPPAGVTYRAPQRAHLAELAHGRWTDPRLGDWLAACEANAGALPAPTEDAVAILREVRRAYDRAVREPAKLVRELSTATVEALPAWAEARAADDFTRFEPWLRRIVELLRERASALGWAAGDEPWDALADHYEPGITARQVEALFAPLRTRLSTLVTELIDQGTMPPAAWLPLPAPIERQQRFVRFVAEAVGFDFHRGRLDVSLHPFCTRIGPNDVRMTTRYREDDLRCAFGSMLHETGHGLYNLGLPATHYGTPLHEPVSLGIHESQSRLWENFVGRSRPFCDWCAGQLPRFFDAGLAGIDGPTLFAAVNRVERGPIRTDADEVTYNLHIVIRFELERAMLRGELDVADLPAAWNARYRDLLGVEPRGAGQGCLQDIHWAGGDMGYFPSYSLGNLYAAQFFEAARAAIDGLDAQFARGDFAPLRRWLGEHIHQHGRRYDADTLCRRVTGAPLSAEPLLRHLEGKYRPLYGRE